jgi:hypothetical protein
VEAAHCQPSIISAQLLNKFYGFSHFTEQNFFVKCKEIMDRKSNTTKTARSPSLLKPLTLQSVNINVKSYFLIDFNTVRT